MEYTPNELPEISHPGTEFVDTPKPSQAEQLDPGPERILRQVIEAAEFNLPVEKQYELRHERRDEQSAMTPPPTPPVTTSPKSNKLKMSLPPPPPEENNHKNQPSKVKELLYVFQQLFNDTSFKKALMYGFFAGLAVTVIIVISTIV
jgi:hypothetical protein